MNGIKISLVAAALAVFALGCANQHQIIEFTPAQKKLDLEPRAPAEISERSPEELSAEGYTKIGFLTVTRVISVCYETCERVEHEHDTATVLLEEAGRRGGELVVLVRHNEEFTRDVKKEGECLEHYSHHGTGPNFMPLGAEDAVVPSEPQAGPHPHEVCTHFEEIHGHENFAESSGSVWRKDSP